MKIKIYQIRDGENNDFRFRDYDSAIAKYGEIVPECYNTTFDGEVDCKTLEDVYVMFNQPRPCVFHSSSLSVSDIVEVTEGTPDAPEGVYFCDSFGYKRLEDFDTNMVKPLNGIRVLAVEPHKKPYETVVPDELWVYQMSVGGYIEVTYPFDDNALIISNEEAKLQGLEGNRRVGNDIYCGNFLIASSKGENFDSLTDSQIEAYKERFSQDESFTVSEIEDTMGITFIGF